MERFENNLHRAIIELRDISPKEGLWEELEQQLGFEKSIVNKTNELPLHMPKEDLWNSIEGELNKERRLIPIWWRWAAVVFLVSGITFLFVKDKDQNKPPVAQIVSEDGPITIQKKELRPSEESIEVPKTYSNNDAKKQEFSKVSKGQARPLFELMALASKSPQTVIEKTMPSDLEIQVVELKEKEKKPHYREVEIVFEQNLRKRKRREPTELEKEREAMYQFLRDQGKHFFMEVSLRNIDTKDFNK